MVLDGLHGSDHAISHLEDFQKEIHPPDSILTHKARVDGAAVQGSILLPTTQRVDLGLGMDEVPSLLLLAE